MTSTILRRSAASAVLILGLTALTGCGGDDTDKAADDPTSDSTSQVTDPSTDAGDPTDEPSEDTSSAPAEGGDVEVSEFVDAYKSALEKATTAHIDIAISGGAADESLDGVADFGTKPPSFQMNIKDPTTGQTQALVLADGVIYVPSTKGRYFKTNIDDAPLGASGVDLFDPEAAVAAFQKGIKKVSLSPGEDVDGESFDHYTLRVDSKTILGAAGTEAPTTGVPAEITYEVYLDQDGLLRRVSIDDLGPTAGTVEVNYDQWGDPVDIEVPDPSKVDELPAS